MELMLCALQLDRIGGLSRVQHMLTPLKKMVKSSIVL